MHIYASVNTMKGKINGIRSHQPEVCLLHGECHTLVGSSRGHVSVIEVIPALFKVNGKRACTRPGLAFGLNFAGEFDYTLTCNCSLVSNKADNYFR